MSTTRPSLKKELEEYNSNLDRCLRSRFGVTLKTFKTIKAAAQLAGAAAGIYAMHLGADPMTSFALVAIILSGPEALEYLINESGPSDE
jgi:hypothetical protein